MNILRRINWTPAIIFMLAANLVPIIGVFAFGWDVGSILVLYWLESVIIGVLNIPKMWACEGGFGSKLFLTPFFIVHFGGFSLGHAFFLKDMFKMGGTFDSLLSGGPLVWTALTFLVSHLFSMFVNFFGKREYEGRLANEQMFFPYGRIIIMHIVIILGGGLVMLLGQPIIALLMLIGFKIAFDIAAHTMEHSGKPQHLIR